MKGENTDWSSAIAEAYMKDPVANKALLADIVNKLFSTEAWTDKAGDDYKVFKNLTSTEGIVSKTFSDDFWTELQSYAIGYLDSDKTVNINLNDPNNAKAIGALFSSLQTVASVSEEFDKAIKDYSRNIQFLESLSQAAPSSGVLSEAINDLIQQYKQQSYESIYNSMISVLKLQSTADKLAGGKGIGFLPETGDNALRDTAVSIVDKLSGLKFGDVDSIIQLATGNIQEISATEKVVYSVYLRSEAITALRNAQNKAKSGNADDLKNYKCAFECAKAVTITQYENMLKYYTGNSYHGADKNNKVSFLQEEIDKLKNMNFWDYAEFESNAF